MTNDKSREVPSVEPIVEARYEHGVWALPR